MIIQTYFHLHVFMTLLGHAPFFPLTSCTPENWILLFSLVFLDGRESCAPKVLGFRNGINPGMTPWAGQARRTG
jgi:hypothetical protein